MTMVLFRIDGSLVGDPLDLELRIEVSQDEDPRSALRDRLLRGHVLGLSPNARDLLQHGGSRYTLTTLPEGDDPITVGVDGRLRFTTWWYWDGATLGDFERAHDAGYLKADPHDWTVQLADGIGGDGPDLQLLVAFLLDRGVNLLFDALVVGSLGAAAARGRRWVTDWRAREIATDWTMRRGLYSPGQLRRWLEKKSEWTWSEVAERLNVGADTAQSLLRALGYEADASKTWRMGWSTEAKERRQEWIENEIREYGWDRDEPDRDGVERP